MEQALNWLAGFVGSFIGIMLVQFVMRTLSRLSALEARVTALERKP